MTQPVPTTADLLVIGAGPAGATTAAFARRAGLSVQVLEQAAFPRFSIGESLLPHAMDVLHEAGLLDALRPARFLEKRGVRFASGDARCDFAFAEAGRGWGWAWQVPRAEFDHRLAQAVEAQGVRFAYRQTVQAVEVSERGASLETIGPSGERTRYQGRFLVDASGNGRVLPRLLGLDAPSSLPPRAALFTHVTGDRRPTGTEEGWIWICVHPLGGAWIWLIPFADGRTSVGVVGELSFFERFAGTPAEQLRAILQGEPWARSRLADATPVVEPRLIKGFSTSVKRVWGPGYCLVGNATEFLDPVFASGVTLALESARTASGLVVRTLRGESPDWEREYAVHMRSGVEVFRHFVERWYDGSIPRFFFERPQAAQDHRGLTSALAGYVWDRENPIVASPEAELARLCGT